MAALTQLPAGARLTAAMLRAVAPLAAYKSAAQSVTSSAALANDSALLVPVAANAVYLVECMLSYQGGTLGASDLKFAWTVPTGAAMAYQVDGITTGGAATAGFLRGITGMAVGSMGAGNNYSVLMSGTFAAGSVAGTLQLQWAQNASSTTPTIVQAGSVLSLWQIQ